ncbi:dihydroorotase [Microscilla marina]|uniref:Dihydroorotase n=1 Tax=Microscilla marina ATCC 23134 TaxID=313606 RepID=A1ZN07_MICM2|nr:dihydroorotase [Microscilla marina]EAY28188.1 dihydroorotase [Microscilla marina ATCC 23134]
MNYLIHNVEIIDKHSEFNRQRKSILIENGVITQISDISPTQSTDHLTVISGQNLQLSAGWFDMRASFCDPGFEYKETLSTGCNAAQAGGFTEVAVLPNTQPVIQTKNELAYLKSHNLRHLVQIYPIAAVSVNAEGKELTEMLDLHTHGAIAFSDGIQPVWHSDILVKTLQYLQKFDGLLINRPEDLMLTRFGTMNEGVSSTMLGLKGMPALAEEMMIRRDLDFLAYAGGKIHFSAISSARSVQLIREAKAQGLQVSCDVAAHQIAIDDAALMSFDSFLKVNPPFRGKTDIEALLEGLQDGTIDVVVSDHRPQDEESKNLEFDLAEFGALGLETAFGVLNTFGKKHLSLEDKIDKLTFRPRQILKLPQAHIKVGEEANLTLFDAQQEWTVEPKHIQSKSKNSPFLGTTLTGKPVAVFSGAQTNWQEKN